MTADVTPQGNYPGMITPGINERSCPTCGVEFINPVTACNDLKFAKAWAEHDCSPAKLEAIEAAEQRSTFTGLDLSGGLASRYHI